MPLRLVQVRECSGECCRESPRWPNKAGTDCLYHDEKGCKIKHGEAVIPDGKCPVVDMSAAEAFRKHCIEWPQQHCTAKFGETANCCWQWVDI